MKAISLWQPYASLIALGAKRYETRSWATAYRGPIAIHAAKRFGAEELALCYAEPFRSALAGGGVFGPSGRGVLSGTGYCASGGGFPLGAIVAVAKLARCLPTTVLGNSAWGLSPVELAFGDFTPGRSGWGLEGVRRLREPVPCRGQQGLWTLPPEIEAEVKGS